MCVVKLTSFKLKSILSVHNYVLLIKLWHAVFSIILYQIVESIFANSIFLHSCGLSKLLFFA